MAIIARLAVLLGLDAGEFNANLGKAKDKVEGFSAGAKVSLGAVAVAFTASAREAINFADKINDVAKANEMSVQSVLRMSQALSTNGGNADDAGKLMASFSNKIDEAAEGSDKAQKAFTKIGVSIQDLKTLSPQELFEKTIKALAGVEDTTKRNALAMDMFGRAIRGVDIKGMADEFENTKNKFAGSDETFKKIGDSVDRLDRFFLNLKVSLADRLAPAFEYVTKAMENWQKKSQGIVDRFAEVRKEAGWWSAWLDKEGIRKYEFPTRGSVQGAEIPSIMSGIGGIKGANPNIRDVKDPNAEKIQKQNEALDQQVRLFEIETKYAGQTLLTAEKLNLEFQKGGKYYEIRNDHQRVNNLLTAASAKDVALLLAEHEKINRAVAQQKSIHAEKVQDEIESINVQMQRLELETKLAGASDRDRENSLKYFDIQQKILNLKKDPAYTEAQIAAIATAEVKLTQLENATKRAQNTFQAGWSRASENFKDKMSDSFSAGENAFMSMTSSMESALDNFVQTGKLSFSDLTRSIIGDLIKIQLKAQALSMFKGLSSLFGFGGGDAGMFTGSTGEIGGSILLGATPKANGGNVMSNMPYLVGERGPELMIPNTSGTIIPNNQLGSMMGGQPQIVYNGPYIQNMSAIDTQSGIQFLSKNKETIWSANQSAQRSLPQSR